VQRVKEHLYDFKPEVKNQAVAEARGEGVRGYIDVHHIIPKWFARKYNLDPQVITSNDNAIALEQNTFHGWIHGKRLDRYDQEVEWKGFDEEDYIFLAVNLYGFDSSLFNKRRR
jgi:hypothetical protein